MGPLRRDVEKPVEGSEETGWLEWPVSRRTMLQRLGVGMGALAVPGMLPSRGLSWSQGGARKGGTLIFGVDSMTGNLEPGIFATYADWMGIEMVARGLTHCDYHTNAVVPAIAHRWDVSRNGSRYTFHLRRGLKFHDGTPVTARDFERSWRRLFNSKDPTQAPGSFTAFSLLGAPVTKSFRALDDLTFEVNLDGADYSFPARCSTIAGVVISSKALAKEGKNIGRNLVGCGPFKFAGYTQDQQAVFTRFDGYYGGAPNLERVIMQIIPDQTALASALRSGSIHVSNSAPLPALRDLNRSKSLEVALGKPYQQILGWVNAASSALSDLRVRQAVNFAIDRKAIVSKGLNGWGVAPAYVGRGVGPGFHPSLRVYSTQDLKRARALVEAAGAAGREISFIAPNNRWWPAVGQIIQQNVESAGLKPKIEYLDQAAFGARQVDPKNHDIALDSFTAVIPDPDDAIRAAFLSTGFFSQAITGGHLVKPTAKKVDALLLRARREKNPAKRAGLYLTLQKLAAQNMMVITSLAYNPAPVVYKSGIKGLNVDALGCYHLFLEKVSLP